MNTKFLQPGLSAPMAYLPSVNLFISPVGLSLVSKVAPKRFTALMMGGWFITTSLGGKIAGIMTGFWDHFDSKALFFGISAAAALIAGVLLFPTN